MNGNQRICHQSISEYSTELSRTGQRNIIGDHGTLWISRRLGAMTRIPNTCLIPPELSELRRVLWRGPALIVDYIQEPDKSHPANASLYICTDQSYSLDKLVPAMRRNVRRGLGELRIALVEFDELLAHGVKAFCDTRRRHGLTDGTSEEFKRRFILRSKCQGHCLFGAWKDDQLAAFLSITEADDWVEIEGSFSQNAYLNSRPNDTLIFNVIKKYLGEEGRRFVTYGVSSIQKESNVDGLEAFKTKVGFQAKPVHRAFVVHPLFHIFINKMTLWGVKTMLRFRPGNPQLKKIGGVIDLIISNR